MDTTKIKREVLILGAVALFTERVGRKPDEEEIKEITESMNLPADTEKQFFSCMDIFANREMKTALQEMVDAWVDSEKGGSKKYNASNMADHLNFTVFRHRYPQISFIAIGDKVSVEVKE